MSPTDSRLTQFLVVGIVACLVVATHAWFNPFTRGRRLFAAGTYAACCWMLGDLLGRWGETFGAQYTAEVVRYLGVVNVPVWLLAFTRAYCSRALARRTIALLFVVPALSFAVMATSPWHRAFFLSMEASPGGLRTRFGPYFWYVHTPYCYLLSTLSIVLVLMEIGRVPRHFRQPMLILLVSLSVPFAINVADLLGLLGRSYNTALSFPIFALLLAVGIFRHRLLTVNPIAYERVFAQIQDGVIILSGDDTILDVNETAARHAGRPRAALVGAPLHEAFASRPELVARLRDRSEFVGELASPGDAPTAHHAIGTSHFVDSGGGYDGRIVTLRDVTLVRRYQQSLEALAYVDALTGLANRRRFEEELGKALQRAARHDGRLAVLYFDLNRFKTVNDTLGHAVGDELLKCVADRVSSVLRAPDLVARLGGDEFVVLLHDTTPAELPVVVARLIGEVERPSVLHGHELTPRLSLGAACHPRDGADAHELLRCADAAMYRAKARGGGAVPLEEG